MTKLLNDVCMPSLKGPTRPASCPATCRSHGRQTRKADNRRDNREDATDRRPQALQKQIEARRDVRVVNEREMNQELRDITLCNNLVACQQLKQYERGKV